jgi:hypothetical protein
MYENKRSTAHSISDGHLHWWALWHRSRLAAKCESENEQNGIRWPLFWNSQINKDVISAVNSACFLLKRGGGRSSTRDFITQAQSLHYATAKEYQCRGLTVALTKSFRLGFEHLYVQNLIFYFIKCSLVTYATLNWFIFIKMPFLHLQNLFQDFKYNNIILHMSVLRGA